jgi:hypothetical protein
MAAGTRRKHDTISEFLEAVWVLIERVKGEGDFIIPLSEQKGRHQTGPPFLSLPADFQLYRQAGFADNLVFV